MFQIEGRHLKGCLFFISKKSPPISVGGLYLYYTIRKYTLFSLKFHVIIHIHKNTCFDGLYLYTHGSNPLKMYLLESKTLF